MTLSTEKFIKHECLHLQKSVKNFTNKPVYIEIVRCLEKTLNVKYYLNIKYTVLCHDILVKNIDLLTFLDNNGNMDRIKLFEYVMAI